MTTTPARKPNTPTPTPQAFSSHIEIPATLERDLQYVVLEGDLSFFQLSYTAQLPDDCPASLKERYKPVVSQGFAQRAAIEKFINGTAVELVADRSMYLASKEFRDDVRNLGYPTAVEKHGAALESARTMENFQPGQYDLDDIVRLDEGSHMLLDRKGQYLPASLVFDYMSGNFSNGAYKLDVALNILLKDPRVTPLSHTRRQERSGASKLKLEILDVPYYNNDSGCQQFLSFRFAPSDADMLAITEQAAKYGAEYASTHRHRAVFDLDILGLRAGGATKFEDFYQSEEYELSKDYSPVDSDSND